MKPRYGSFRLARVTWLEIGRSTAKTSMCAGSYSSTSRPSITTLAPCAATHRAGPKRGVAWPRSSSARGVWHRCPGAGAETPRRAGRTAQSDWRVVGAPMRRASRGVSSRVPPDVANPSARRPGRGCSLCVSRTSRVQTGLPGRRRHHSNGTSSVDSTLAETSDSDA